jgi:uncharacterized protein (DUF2336 family)
MIVRHFLQWVRTAAAGERAEATSALARAYLYSELSPDDRVAAEGAMIMLLDDPSPLVRQALAEAIAASPDAPPAVIHALTSDQPDIAAVVLERSPLLIDADLVDLVGAGERASQVAIARRTALPRPVAAAIAEVGSAEACLVLIENPVADIAPLSIDRIAERFGHLAAIREALFERADVAAATRQGLLVKLSETLGQFVLARRWLSEGRARRVTQEACEKATIALAGISERQEMQALVRHLRKSGQLTAGLVLRALLSGNLPLFEAALAELSDLPLSRVSALVHDRRSTGVRALCESAGLPPSVIPAIRVALEATYEVGFLSDLGGATRLKRRMIERVLTRCESELTSDVEPLLILLRRFATEAAREEARLFCEDLAAA